jgi:hypothetical protein
MRRLAFALATLLAACSRPPETIGLAPDAGTGGSADGGNDAAPTSDSGPPPPPARGFRITSPDIPVYPGEEITFCYYFQTPNTTELSVKKWVSHMTPGSHHLVVFFTPTMLQHPGTSSTRDCGFSTGGPVWMYSAQAPDAEAALPLDDGHGIPVGQPIKAGQYGFIQVHYLNATDNVIQAHVQLDAVAHDEGIQVTPAGPFVTFNDQITIGPGTPTNPTRVPVDGTCDFHTMTGGPFKFYSMTTHTHKQGVRTFVTDGGAMVVDNTSWDHPGIQSWNTSPFFSFSTSALTYHCEYLNPNNRTIKAGNNPATDEMCMAVGFYFPAPGGAGHLCWNDQMIY